jgi:hypothetical protein
MGLFFIWNTMGKEATMAVRISCADVEGLIGAVNEREILPKKKMEVLEAFIERYADGLGSDGKRSIMKEIERLSRL